MSGLSRVRSAMTKLVHNDHPGILIRHSSSWIGEVDIYYGDDRLCWSVDAEALLSGKVGADPRSAEGRGVPIDVIAQAVAMAVRAKLTSEMIRFAEARC